MNDNFIKENQEQRCFDYAPNQRVLKKKWNSCKLGKRTSGLYTILHTHVNDTITIKLEPGVTE